MYPKTYFLFLWMSLKYYYTESIAFFPTNSAYGIFGAIAVPLDLPHRNIFLSYNFEANYNLPYIWNIPPYLYGIEDEDVFDEARKAGNKQCNNCSDTEEVTTMASTMEESTEDEKKSEERGRRSLLTRTFFYHMLQEKFKRSGYKGEECLLRMICQVNSSQIGDSNGVLGSIFHIIFSPTTSQDENLPLKYYEAEYDGQHDNCWKYEEECEESVLDLISLPVHDIIDKFINKV